MSNRPTSGVMTTGPEATRRKQARLAMRLTPDQDALIRDAAAATGQSLTDFVTMAASLVPRTRSPTDGSSDSTPPPGRSSRRSSIVLPGAFPSLRSCSTNERPGTRPGRTQRSDAAASPPDRADGQHRRLRVGRSVTRPLPHRPRSHEPHLGPGPLLRLHGQRQQQSRRLLHTVSGRRRARKSPRKGTSVRTEPCPRCIDGSPRRRPQGPRLGLGLGSKSRSRRHLERT